MTCLSGTPFSLTISAEVGGHEVWWHGRSQQLSSEHAPWRFWPACTRSSAVRHELLSLEKIHATVDSVCAAPERDCCRSMAASALSAAYGWLEQSQGKLFDLWSFTWILDRFIFSIAFSILDRCRYPWVYEDLFFLMIIPSFVTIGNYISHEEISSSSASGKLRWLYGMRHKPRRVLQIMLESLRHVSCDLRFRVLNNDRGGCNRWAKIQGC